MEHAGLGSSEGLIVKAFTEATTLQDAMTKPSQSPLRCDAGKRQYGSKVGQVQTSLAAFAVRDALSHEEAKEELEGLPAAG